MPNSWVMDPAPGDRLLRFVGDRVEFRFRPPARTDPNHWRCFLRTNLGRGVILRQETIQAHSGRLGLAQSAWRDIPMHPKDGEWHREITLSEVGFFRAKAYAVDEQGRQFWPEGADAGISIHPDSYRSANTIYCAFVRMFGESKSAISTENPKLEQQLKELDRRGYTVIPGSGKFRDLIKHLPHIINTLNCRILQLLPVNPTPTTYARMGRYGSPYASQDLTAVDPALVEFDRRTTGIDQFRELTYATHLRGARLFLDLVINHTGWGARLQEKHPEWYLRAPDGSFACPGAWGVTWEDLVELDHRNPALWEDLAEVFLTWCRRGVDGFRCDAGYKIPVDAWKYITARVIDEYPETIFLLEGLGGSWEATEALLTEGGMQWAYSELFQNYSGRDVAWYLEYALRQSRRVGLYTHYSETHDNPRLAEKGRTWSLLRNQLCALSSVSGAYGFTAGVEWLATEKIRVHGCTGMSWGHGDNLVTELGKLNHLLADHPCFLDGARLTRHSPDDSTVLALGRISADGLDRVLVILNTDPTKNESFKLPDAIFRELGKPSFDLLLQKPFTSDLSQLSLAPGECLCLAPAPVPVGLAGQPYRIARAQAAWAVVALTQTRPAEDFGPFDWRELARRVVAGPEQFLACLGTLNPHLLRTDPLGALHQAASAQPYPNVITWELIDARRITPVPPHHWLLLSDLSPFRASLSSGKVTRHVQSIPCGPRQIASFPPGLFAGDATLFLERYTDDEQPQIGASLRFLSVDPNIGPIRPRPDEPLPEIGRQTGLALLTNGLGGMARLQVNLGDVQSKYDCALAANLHTSVPVDRHVFVKRIRAWVVADGFIKPLNRESLLSFQPGPPAHWRFVASAGDGRAVEIHLEADMLAGRNATVFRFTRPATPPAFGKDLPAEAKVTLTVRVDIEDRNFHTETHRNGGAEFHFSSHSRPLQGRIGFEFTPEQERQLKVFADKGQYHHEGEWSTGLFHPIEASRGQPAHADAYSPGWFNLPMSLNSNVTLLCNAERGELEFPALDGFTEARVQTNSAAIARAHLPAADEFGQQLALAIQTYVVRRGRGKTVIAGYPWFLDWGRDSLICARGLIAAGLTEEVLELLSVFGRFVEQGTLPNSIHGEDASNRDTTDAPLWYGIVCEELAKAAGPPIYDHVVDAGGRSIRGVLTEIASGYLSGTPNGIRVDRESGLVWSPAHFTWMDTNYPAGTPRQGYPVEIQALWIRLLRQLTRIDKVRTDWAELAAQAEKSFQEYFWMEEVGYLSDLLAASPGQGAADARKDDALRSNGLFAISLGLLGGERAQRAVAAAQKYLVIPGALRTLAPLPVTMELPIYSADGRLLNDPLQPYAASYQGDEDTSRKPAYHNGTAWLWTFPSFCEALVRAWDFRSSALAAGRAYLASMDHLLQEGCLGQLPEILDGDKPHQQRGCDAQAWSVTEALRVWKLLNPSD